MPKLKYHGATLAENEIKKYFPINPNYPQFEYFLFHYRKDDSDHYYFNVYAVNKNGGIIDKVTVSKDNPTVPVDFTTWVPMDLYIGVTNQLSKIPVSSGEAIKEIRLLPKKDPVYDVVSYDVKIKVGNILTVFSEELKPSPPASVDDNTWSF